MRPARARSCGTAAACRSWTPRRASAARLQTQMIFQDPFASLNPRLRVADHRGRGAGGARARAARAARRVGGRASCARVGLDPALAQPLSAPVQRRPARACGHRAGAGACSPRLLDLRRGRWRRWTCRSRRRCSTCSWNCAGPSR
jgi:ABC-type oligopeptide transport system ATPase subunit